VDRLMGGFIKYTIDIYSGNISSGIQKLIGANTHTQDN
jgi:hypothetical protein